MRKDIVYKAKKVIIKADEYFKIQCKDLVLPNGSGRQIQVYRNEFISDIFVGPFYNKAYYIYASAKGISIYSSGKEYTYPQNANDLSDNLIVSVAYDIAQHWKDINKIIMDTKKNTLERKIGNTFDNFIV